MGWKWCRIDPQVTQPGKKITGESEQKVFIVFYSLLLLRESGPVGVETRKEVGYEGGTPVTQARLGASCARAASSSEQEFASACGLKSDSIISGQTNVFVLPFQVRFSDAPPLRRIDASSGI